MSGPEAARRAASGPSEPVAITRYGEVLGSAAELAQLPPETLAEALLELREHNARAKASERMLNEALQQHLDTRGRNKLPVGDFELHRKERNDAVWDVDGLETVLADLVEQGIVEAAEVTEVIRRKVEVSKSAGGELVRRLTGPQREAVAACRTWRKSLGPVEVVRSLPLLPSGNE